MKLLYGRYVLPIGFIVLSSAAFAGNGQLNNASLVPNGTNAASLPVGGDTCAYGWCFSGSLAGNYTNNVQQGTGASATKVNGGYGDGSLMAGYGWKLDGLFSAFSVSLTYDEKAYAGYQEDDGSVTTLDPKLKFSDPHWFIEVPLAMNTKSPEVSTEANGTTLYTFNRTWSASPTLGWQLPWLADYKPSASLAYADSSNSTQTAVKFKAAFGPALWGKGGIFGGDIGILPDIHGAAGAIKFTPSATPSWFTSPKPGSPSFQTVVGLPLDWTYSNIALEKDGGEKIFADITLIKLNANYTYNPSPNGKPLVWEVGPKLTVHF